MTSQNPRAIIFVSDYWLVGTVPTSGNRLQDTLKEPNTAFVRLIDVSVFRYVGNEETTVGTLPEVVVPKRRIELIVLPDEQHEAPVKRHNNFATRETISVFVIAGRYTVHGQLHVTETQRDSLHTFSGQLGTFFPITGASVNAEQKRLDAPIAFANREFVSCFYAGNVESSGQCETVQGNDGKEESFEQLLADCKTALAE